MTLTSFLMVVGFIGLAAFIGSIIYFRHHDNVMKENQQ